MIQEEADLRRVLIISYHFPPRPAIGSVRLEGLAKYLPRYGWEPVVLTPTYPGGPDKRFEVIETGYLDVVDNLKKRMGLRNGAGLQEQLHISQTLRSGRFSPLDPVVKALKTFICYPDDQRGWLPFALQKARSLIREGFIDAIITSSKPETSHLIGAKLRQELHIPWVADLRDLWTQNHYYEFLSFRKIVERRLELKTLNSANALVTVSAPLAQLLQELHREKTIYSITNGFDPDSVSANPKLTSEFTVTYTGSLYRGKRDPRILLEAVRNLIKLGVMEPTALRIRFYGEQGYWIKQEISSYGLDEVVELHGHIKREDALKRQGESQVLLLLTWNNPRESGVYTGKLFEYLAARRPILALGGTPGVVGPLLEETRTGFHVANVSETMEVLHRWWIGYLNSGYVPYYGRESAISRYSQNKMAERFAEVLNDITRASKQDTITGESWTRGN